MRLTNLPWPCEASLKRTVGLCWRCDSGELKTHRSKPHRPVFERMETFPEGHVFEGGLLCPVTKPNCTVRVK